LIHNKTSPFDYLPSAANGNLGFRQIIHKASFAAFFFMRFLASDKSYTRYKQNIQARNFHLLFNMFF